MKVEVLYFEGCPNLAPVKEMVRRILEREKIQAEVRAVEVGDVDTAQTLRFLGSPSVRVNGVDIEPGRENDPPFYGCRTYTVEGKTTGAPPVEWLAAVFHEQGDEKVLSRGGKRRKMP